MSKILITGASGFIGQNLCKTLSTLNRFVRGLLDLRTLIHQILILNMFQLEISTPKQLERFFSWLRYSLCGKSAYDE